MMKTTPILVTFLSAAAPWAVPLDGDLVEILVKALAMALGPVAMFIALRLFKGARAALRATADQLDIVAEGMKKDTNPENDGQANAVEHTANVLRAIAEELDEDGRKVPPILSRDPKVREAALAASLQRRHTRDE